MRNGRITAAEHQAILAALSAHPRVDFATVAADRGWKLRTISGIARANGFCLQGRAKRGGRAA